MLRIFLFGGCHLEYAGDALPPIPGQKARALLCYLILYRHRAHSRDLLAGTFWPDLTNAKARRRLSHALWQIRHTLSALSSPVPFILAKADTIRINPQAPYWLDIAEFEELIDREIGRSETGKLENEAQRSTRQPTNLPIYQPTNPPVYQSTHLPTLRQAVDLYAGDFLAGFYDDWAVIERERFREMFLAALSRLVELCKGQGTHDEALRYARRLAAEDPLREEGHREVMRLCYLLGRGNEALQQYELCRAVLARELDAEPTATTTALYRKIVARVGDAKASYLPPAPGGSPSPLLEGTGQVPLVGRERERTTLVNLIEQTTNGQGGIVLVEGEAGVGKTRLLQEVANDAEWRGVRALWGRGRELAEPAPYGLLIELLRSGLSPLRAEQLAQVVDGIWLRVASLLLPELAEWLPDLPPRVALEPDQERVRLLEALIHIIVALGQIAPHLLILEDLQWADEATLEELMYLARRLRDSRITRVESRVMLIGSCRGEEARERAAVWETLQALDRAGCQRLKLAALTAAETGELVRQGLGLRKGVPHFEARLYRETGGNPLFVLETLRGLHDEGILDRDTSGRWSTPWDETTTDYAELPLPTGVYQVIVRRLVRLGPDERTLLNTAAVLGADFDLALLLQSADLERKWALAATSELVRRQILVERPDAYLFSHDKVRQVAYMEVPETERRRLHRRAGAALETLSPSRIAELAHHFEQGHVWQKAVHYHTQAGKQAQRVHTPAMAVEHFTAAIDMAKRAGLSQEQQFDLFALREASLEVLGEREAQAADLAAMVQQATDNPQLLATVWRRRAMLLMHIGRSDDAEAAAQGALTVAEQAQDHVAQAAALFALGSILRRRGRADAAIQRLETAIALYHRVGDLAGEAEAQHALAATHHTQSQYAAARRAAQIALDLREQQHDRLGQAKTLGLLGTIHMEQGNHATAMDCYRQALDIARAAGYRYGEGLNLTNLGNLFYFQGQITSALEHYDQAITAFANIGDRRGEAYVRANAATLRQAILGDHETAAADASAALAFFREAGDRGGEAQCLDTLGEIARQKGDLVSAHEYLEAALAASQAAGDRWTELSNCRSLISLLLDEKCPERASAYLEKATMICRELQLAERTVDLLMDKAGILLEQGQFGAALEASTQAMAGLKPGVEQAYLAPFIHYRILQALGNSGAAQAALTQAHQLLMAFLEGLSPDQQRLSIAHVAAHREIIAAWQATQSLTTRRLPRADVPTGRPLRDDEWVEIVWTLTAPEDEAIAGKARPERGRRIARRRHRLQRLLREAGEQGAAPTVDDLASVLKVSRATVKRDLAALRAAGHTVRTRGRRKARD